ncbi:YfgM family protein [Macromonas nakdongensis]|uniref:YfgM family protein n=1 Tax=Macromonas nakdongensis TaxID=1843082 RepID=UPI000C31D405|nr:tetratricopeptide repeat protein [Macromonas nakdongensis]
MATHYDLEEQEQLAQMKHFWAKYGNLITWALIAVLGAFAAWNGWQYWQRKSALEAAALYDELDRAAQAQDRERVQRVWADVQAQAGRTVQAQQAGLLAARVFEAAAQLDAARQALQFVAEASADADLASVARLRLAGLELQAKQPDAALKWLASGISADFKALAADRQGDALLAQGKADEARQAYEQAWTAMDATQDYRRLVEAKLNTLGVNPGAGAAPQLETSR